MKTKKQNHSSSSWEKKIHRYQLFPIRSTAGDPLKEFSIHSQFSNVNIINLNVRTV